MVLSPGAGLDTADGHHDFFGIGGCLKGGFKSDLPLLDEAHERLMVGLHPIIAPLLHDA